MPEYVISVQLQRKINFIKAADVKAKKAVFEIAYALAELADEQNFMLSDAGYKDIAEFAADQFGYARSTTLNYVKIANRYLTGNNKEVRTICADLDDGGKATEDYKIGQLNALPGNVDRDEFRRLDADGIINKHMSADRIKQTLKEFYKPPTDPEPEDTDDGEQEQEPEQIPCLTLPVIQIFLNVVTPCIDYGDSFRDEAAERAVNIFNEFFHGAYGIHWIHYDDGEITGADLIDIANTKNGDVIFTTNQDV